MSSRDNFFRNVGVVKDNCFFDDGPLVRHIRNPIGSNSNAYINTSSIDLSSGVAHRQGVEITDIKHFDAGGVKIYAGEAGHEIKPANFGMSRRNNTITVFEERPMFSAKEYIESGSISCVFDEVVADSNPIDTFPMNGTIELLPITSRTHKFVRSNDVIGGFRGALIGGNNDFNNASDVVVDIVNYDDRVVHIFDDNTHVSVSDNTLQPFLDVRYSRNIITASSTEDTELINVMSLMSGSTDNYVDSNKRAAGHGCSSCYLTLNGTDSIAFAGMTH